MKPSTLVLNLSFEPGAPQPNSDLWAADRQLQAELRPHGSKAFPQVYVQDDAHGVMQHLGEWTIQAGPFVAPAISAVAGAWLQTRVGRKARLKFGDIEVEASTPAEIEKLLALIPKKPAGPTQGGDEQ